MAKENDNGALALGVVGVGLLIYFMVRHRTSTSTTTSTPSTSTTTPSTSTTTPSHASPAVSTVPAVPSSASSQTRLQALLNDSAVSIPGLSAADVGRLQSLVRSAPGAIAGVLSNGTLVLNPTNSGVPDLLASLVPGQFPGVSIPGVSAGEMGQLIVLAREGRLKGVTSRGAAQVSGVKVTGGSGYTYTAQTADCLHHTLSGGASGDCVKLLQTLLNRAPGFHGVHLGVDGHYGPLTALDVRLFQIFHGLTATGQVDADTWSALTGGAPT